VSEAPLIVRDLHKRYDGVHAARGVSFEVREGEIFGLLGPNGAGKTTTVECVLGLREPDSGAVEVCGVDARRHPRQVKEKIGAALQTTALQDKITPREAIRLFGSFFPTHDDPDALLNRFLLSEKADAPFDSLSGGQRQRLALALAFVNRPSLVFLDEPTAGLDPQSRRDLHGEIARMKADGHTVLLTTHHLDEAQALCDRVAIMHRGRIVATGSPQELLRQSSETPRVEIRTVQPLDAIRLDDLPGISDLAVERHRATFHSAAVTPAVAELLQRLAGHDIEVAELHVQKGTLESLFFALLDASREAPAGGE
jgi:ABC-2 type transport system ATP-binding protein